MTQHSLLDVEKRSFKLNGKATSIELERVFWHLMDNTAKSHGSTWGKIATSMVQRCPAGVPHARCVRVLCVMLLLQEAKRNGGKLADPA